MAQKYFKLNGYKQTIPTKTIDAEDVLFKGLKTSQNKKLYNDIHTAYDPNASNYRTAHINLTFRQAAQQKHTDL